MEMLKTRKSTIFKRITAFALMLIMSFSIITPLKGSVTAEANTGEIELSALTYAEKVERAANGLEKMTVINNAQYWINNYSKLTYLGDLIIKMGDQTYKIGSTRNITSVYKAIELLNEKGVINSPDYWNKNWTKVTYLRELLIKVANQIN